jgi:hypothetical protein
LGQVIGQSNNKKRVRLSEYIEQQGVAVFENIRKMNLEGILPKEKIVNTFKEQDRKTGSKSRTQKHKIV